MNDWEASLNPIYSSVLVEKSTVNLNGFQLGDKVKIVYQSERANATVPNPRIGRITSMGKNCHGYEWVRLDNTLGQENINRVEKL